VKARIRLYVTDPGTVLEAENILELQQVPRVGESLYVSEDIGPFVVQDVSWHLPDGVFIVARERLTSPAYTGCFGEISDALKAAGWDVTVRP